MEEDPLKGYVDASGISGRVFEALQGGGDLQSLIWGILPQMTGMLPEMNSDSPLATVMRLILAKNGMPTFGTTGQSEGDGQLAAVATSAAWPGCSEPARPAADLNRRAPSVMDAASQGSLRLRPPLRNSWAG